MKTLIVILSALALSACNIDDITTGADVQAAILNCEIETGQQCKMIALPLDAEVEAWDLYYSHVGQCKPSNGGCL